jgi:hypothetical protein
MRGKIALERLWAPAVDEVLERLAYAAHHGGRAALARAAEIISLGQHLRGEGAELGDARMKRPSYFVQAFGLLAERVIAADFFDDRDGALAAALCGSADISSRIS